MFGSLLFVLSTFGAEPAETTSLATCVRPVARLAVPKIEHVAGATRSTDCRQIALWLRRWEQTAKRRPALSAARRDVLRHRVESTANAHAAAALELMTGPLDITRLRESFAWSITDRDAGRVQLEATPRDETERLFYASIRVWLDETDGALNQLQVTNRSGETRFVWRNNAAPEPSPIQFASAIEEAASLIIGSELPSPLQVIPAVDAFADEHDCANAQETLSESSIFDSVPYKRANQYLPWPFGPTMPGNEGPDPTDLSAVTSELETILTQWEEASRKTKTVNAKFKRTVYNTIFEVEKRSEGRMTYRAPRSMTISIEGEKLARGEVGRRTGVSGKPFRLEADRSETLAWIEDTFTWANDNDKTYEVEVVPANERLQRSLLVGHLFGSFEKRFPFLFEIRSEQLRREWNLTLAKVADGKAFINVTPRTAMLKQWYGRCHLRLDTTNWHVDAVKFLNPTEQFETVIVFQSWQTNPDGQSGWKWEPVFVNFRARGYKQMNAP